MLPAQQGTMNHCHALKLSQRNCEGSDSASPKRSELGVRRPGLTRIAGPIGHTKELDMRAGQTTSADSGAALMDRRASSKCTAASLR